MLIGFSGIFGLENFLDLGSGTGRTVWFFRDRCKVVRGVEPVAALIEQAVHKGVPNGVIVNANGYDLPFDDESFDAVLECGFCTMCAVGIAL